MRVHGVVWIIFVLTAFCPFNSKAQDSVKAYLSSKDFFLFENTAKTRSISYDSSFNHIQDYFQRNLMGNIGLPDYEFLLSYKENPIGVKWFSSPYDNRIMGLTEQNLYWKKGINTNAFGAIGSTNEQVFKLSHIQNITENWNVALKLNRYGATGFYQKQQSFVNNALFSTNYLAKNKRFGVYITYGFDRFRHQESGGITSDSAIVSDVNTTKLLIPVKLQYAKRNYSLMTSSARLFFRLNNDSLSKIGHYVILGADGSLNKSIYNDVPSSLYDTSYFSLTTTNDTTRFNRLSPALSYNLVAHNISFEVGGKMDYMRWYMHDTDRVFNVYKDYAIDSSIWATPDTMMAYRSFTALQRFAWNKKDSTLELRQHTSYIVSGKNKGDYQAAVSLNYKIKFLQTSFALHVNTELRSPDLFYAFNRVNNAYWKNDFEKSASNTIQFEARSQKLQLQLGAVHRNINKMIFLAGNQQPVQTKGAVNVTRLYVKHHLKLFKFHLENCINYQLAEQYPLPMPSLYTQHQLYFEQRVKKNGLRFQIGVQANYAGEMELVSYNPALNSFYVPDVKNKGGNYVFADFFVNVYFKPVRFFFKLEHANQGFSGMNYTLLNNYYQPDRMFHLGINWEFWD